MEKGMHQNQTIQQPGDAAGSVAAHGILRKNPADMYVASVDAAMARLAGVTWSEISESLHGQHSRDAIRSAIEAPESTRNFAERIVASFGFKRNAPGTDPDLVRGYNLTQAHIIDCIGEASEEFGDNWKLGPDGIVTKEEADGLAVLRPVRVPGTAQYGFGISYHEGAYRLENGTAMDLGAGTAITGKFDLGPAVQKYEEQMANQSSLKM